MNAGFRKILFLLGTGAAIILPLCNLYPQEYSSEKKLQEKKEETELKALGDESRSLLEEARSYRHLGLLDPSLDRYQRLIELQPKNSFILKEAADTYAKAKNFTAAKELYGQALFLKPYDPDLRLAWVRALQDNGRRSEAIQELRELVKDDPSFIEAYRELATYLGWDKKWKEAIEEYDHILQAVPDDKEALLGKARALNWSGKWKEAIPLYEKMMEQDPQNADALRELALLYSWTQQWKKSQAAFQKLIREHPGDSQALEELGNAYFYDQNYQAARRVYTQVAQSNPDASRRLNARFSDVGAAAAPTLSYSFLYYAEIDHNGSKSRLTETIYNTLEYSHPFGDVFRLIASIASRHDDIIKLTSFTYGLGWQTRLLKNLWHRIDLKWEPRNAEVNPRWGLRNALSWRPWEGYELNLFHQFTTYWDRNESNSVGVGISRAFFQKRDVVLSYRLTYDVSSDPSSYFVSIKKKPGENLDLFTNTVSLEKYWAFFKKGTVTTGMTYDVTTEGRNTMTLYGNMGYRVLDRTYISGGGSWSKDNREIETVSASGSCNLRF